MRTAFPSDGLGRRLGQSVLVGGNTAQPDQAIARTGGGAVDLEVV